MSIMTRELPACTQVRDDFDQHQDRMHLDCVFSTISDNCCIMLQVRGGGSRMHMTGCMHGPVSSMLHYVAGEREGGAQPIASVRTHACMHAATRQRMCQEVSGRWLAAWHACAMRQAE